MVNHPERESTNRLRRQSSRLNTPTPQQILSLRALVVADLANELIQYVPGYAAPGLQLIRSEMESIGFDVLDLDPKRGESSAELQRGAEIRTSMPGLLPEKF